MCTSPGYTFGLNSKENRQHPLLKIPVWRRLEYFMKGSFSYTNMPWMLPLGKTLKMFVSLPQIGGPTRSHTFVFASELVFPKSLARLNTHPNKAPQRHLHDRLPSISRVSKRCGCVFFREATFWRGLQGNQKDTNSLESPLC